MSREAVGRAVIGGRPNRDEDGERRRRLFWIAVTILVTCALPASVEVAREHRGPLLLLVFGWSVLALLSLVGIAAFRSLHVARTDALRDLNRALTEDAARTRLYRARLREMAGGVDAERAAPRPPIDGEQAFPLLCSVHVALWGARGEPVTVAVVNCREEGCVVEHVVGSDAFGLTLGRCCRQQELLDRGASNVVGFDMPAGRRLVVVAATPFTDADLAFLEDFATLLPLLAARRPRRGRLRAVR